jgi:CO/xanthine dehydrogenase Mo-binding subunit
MVRTELSDALQIPLSKIRIIVPYVGGGFGNKLELKAEAMATALALFTSGRAVKLKWSREEAFNYSSHPSIVYAKDGFKKDGTLIAREMSWILDTGAYGGWSCLKVKNSAFGALGIYKVPNFKLDAYGVFTNKPITVSQRGFGSRQPIWAIENQMDIAARDLGIDPVELRLKNCMEEGDINASGEKMESIGAKECLMKVGEAMKKWKPIDRGSGAIKRGRGIAIGTKYSLVPIAASAIVKVCEDGTVEVRSSAVDMGQGTYTILAETAAEEFKIPVERVKLVRVDTAITPFGFGASSNSQTQIAGNALRWACDDVKQQVFRKAAPMLDAKPEELDTKDSTVFVKSDPENAIPFTDLFTYMPLSGMFLDEGGEFIGKATAYRTGTVAQTDPSTGHTEKMSNYWGYSCLGVEVEVDTQTGNVRVARAVSALDCGKALHPPGVEGQIEGSFSMGLGQALTEEMIFDKQGRHLNPSFRDYKLPTITDHPPFDSLQTIIVECFHEPDRMWGAKGVGEAAITPMVAGIGIAVMDAIGVRLHRPPITPERILRALEKIK